MVRVYTSTMDYVERDRLDITRKNAEFSQYGKVFAPSWETLNRWISARSNGRKAKAAWEAYRASFREEMIASYRANREIWDAILELEEVTLVCFCTDPNRCHRQIVAAEMLAKLGAAYGGER